MVSASQDGAIDRAVEKLMLDDVVAVPTETVYGLAADAHSEKAVQKIYEIKGRPSYNPLICHVSGPEMAARYIAVSAPAKKLMDMFWPGPLTIVSARKPGCEITESVSAGLVTLAVRCPDNKITQAILTALDRAIAAPSANISGRLSPTTAESVNRSLSGKIPLIIDDGQTAVGIESTIIAVDGDQITLLRPGTVSVDEISDCASLPVHDRDTTIITAPGQINSHYAPNAKVILNCDQPNDHAFIGFGGIEGNKDLNLSPDGDLAEAAHNLFEFLRKADAMGNDTIAVATIPKKGIGIAINDRLARAAAPRRGQDRQVTND